MKLAVDSGPGTGKTYSATTLCMWLKSENKSAFLEKRKHTEEQKTVWEYVYERMKDRIHPKMSILYASYNKDFIPEIKSKVPAKGPFAPDVRTIHGAGYKVLNSKYGYLRMNENRGLGIVESLTGQSFYKLRDRYQWLSAIRFTSKLKDELLNPTPENLELLKAKYDGLANFASGADVAERCSKLIKSMKTIDRKSGIEFVDQVWLPLFLLKKPIYDLGIIDECQDLSPSRLLLCLKLCKDVVFVGDPDQAINAFAGADPRAFEKIADEVDDILPLKLSFRNPPNIVNKANALMKRRIVPDTRPRTWLKTAKTEDGKETSCTLNLLPSLVSDHHPSNLIVCRFNAPLFQAAAKLTRAGIPSFIYGKSIIKELMGIINNRKAHNIDDLGYKLQEWEERTCKGANEYVSQAIQDKVSCIKHIMDLCDDLEQIEDTMTDIIREDKKDSVRLSTIHKAKGKEAPHVHILFPPIESGMARTDDQKQQEQNLHFVAMTRTMQDYNLIHRE